MDVVELAHPPASRVSDKGAQTHDDGRDVEHGLDHKLFRLVLRLLIRVVEALLMLERALAKGPARSPGDIDRADMDKPLELAASACQAEKAPGGGGVDAPCYFERETKSRIGGAMDDLGDRAREHLLARRIEPELGSREITGQHG